MSWVVDAILDPPEQDSPAETLEEGAWHSDPKTRSLEGVPAKYPLALE